MCIRRSSPRLPVFGKLGARGQQSRPRCVPRVDLVPSTTSRRGLAEPPLARDVKSGFEHDLGVTPALEHVLLGGHVAGFGDIGLVQKRKVRVSVDHAGDDRMPGHVEARRGLPRTPGWRQQARQIRFPRRAHRRGKAGFPVPSQTIPPWSRTLCISARSAESEVQALGSVQIDLHRLTVLSEPRSTAQKNNRPCQPPPRSPAVHPLARAAIKDAIDKLRMRGGESCIAFCNRCGMLSPAASARPRVCSEPERAGISEQPELRRRRPPPWQGECRERRRRTCRSRCSP